MTLQTRKERPAVSGVGSKCNSGLPRVARRLRAGHPRNAYTACPLRGATATLRGAASPYVFRLAASTRAAETTVQDDGPSTSTSAAPLLDARLSVADRAVLALARAAADVSNRAAAERAAAAHGLVLVTSSEACLVPLVPLGSTMDDEGEYADGMALAPPLERLGATEDRAGPRTLLSSVFSSRTSTTSAAVSAAARPVMPPRPVAPSRPVADGAGGGDDTETEDESDLSGASAASAAAAAAGGSGTTSLRASAATPAAAATPSTGLLGAAAAALSRMAKVATEAAEAQAAAPLQRPTVAARAKAGATAAAASVAQAAARASANMLPLYGDSSSSWLVADDPAGSVRYIVVAAGPDLGGRGPGELQRDLVTFETYGLGAKVNKKLYAEATSLYARFMPLVMDHLEANPWGTVCFGGEGVGGSLAVLLQLMAVARGLRFARLLPAVSVGGQAVVAQVPREQRRLWGSATDRQGPNAHHHGHLDLDHVDDLLEDLMSRTVLEELGLPQDAVRNIVLQQPQGSRPKPAAQQGAALAGSGGGGQAGAGPLAGMPMQVFRLVGKVVEVETVGSVSSSRALAAAERATAMTVRPLSTAAAVGGGEPSVMPFDSVEFDTDGSSGQAGMDPAAAARNAGGQPGNVFGMGMISSIAAAATKAAAAAAAQQLRLLGASALKAATGSGSGGASARQSQGPSKRRATVTAAAAKQLAAPPAALALPPPPPIAADEVRHLQGVAGQTMDDEEAAAWGV